MCEYKRYEEQLDLTVSLTLIMSHNTIITSVRTHIQTWGHQSDPPLFRCKKTICDEPQALSRGKAF